MKKQTSVMPWLIAACLCAGLLPDFVGSVLELCAGVTLPTAVSLLLLLLAEAGALVLFEQGLYLRFGRDLAGTKRRPALHAYLLGVFPCLLVYLLFQYGAGKLAAVFAILSAVRKGLLLLCILILTLIFAVLSGLLFFTWLSGCRLFPLKSPVRRFFSRFYLSIPMSLVLWLGMLVMPLGITVLCAALGDPNVLIRHLLYFACCLAAAGLLNGAVSLTGKIMMGAETDMETSRPGAPAKWIPQAMAAAVCLVLILSQNLAEWTGNETALLKEQLKESLTEYGLYLAAGNLSGAAETAQEAIDAMDEALAAAEEAGNSNKVQKVCDRYDIFRTDGQALILLEEYEKNGGADDDLVEEALTLSEENPDSLWIQYTAAYLGSSLNYDNAPHYDRTAKAILRWLDQYAEENGESGEEYLSYVGNAAQMLLSVYHAEDAVDILEESGIAESGSAEACELLAKAYDQNDQSEEAYALATEYCAEHTDSPYLMYEAAVSSLKTGKTAECLQYTSELAAYTAAAEGDELKQCDIHLFEMLEYLAMNDNSQYTGFQYKVYEDLTEEENAIIDANPFFRNYLDAVYLTYCTSLSEGPDEAYAKMEAVLTENQDLASAWYLCGVIASTTSEEYWEDAIDCYRRAAELNDEIPAVWYAMGREYDRLGEYEKAIEACRKALALLPEQDHGEDWYGINYHCSALLRSLENAVAEGK